MNDDGYYVPGIENENFNFNQPMNTNISFDQPTFGNDPMPPPADWYGQDSVPPDAQMPFNPIPGEDFPYPSMSSPSNQTSASSGSISQSNSSTPEVDYDNEPPLLEELGIDFADIWNKTKSVLIPTRKFDPQVAGDSDLAGPLVFLVLLCFCLLMTGKISFGVIWGYSMVSSIIMYLMLNLMNDTGISFDRTASILGYSLLPIVLFSAVNIVLNLRGYVGAVLATITIAWCTFSATRYFEVLLSMREQRYLVAYPVIILYACFALLTVF